jgi:hypothetical protein
VSELKGTPAEYKAGLDYAIAKGWLILHEIAYTPTSSPAAFVQPQESGIRWKPRDLRKDSASARKRNCEVVMRLLKTPIWPEVRGTWQPNSVTQCVNQRRPLIGDWLAGEPAAATLMTDVLRRHRRQVARLEAFLGQLKGS